MYARSPLALDRHGLAFVLALHGAAFWGLLQMKLATLPAPLAALTVSLLPPAEAIKPQPNSVRPQPKPVASRPTPAPQSTQLAAPAESPTESPAPAPVAVTPAPTVAAAPAASAPVAAPSQPRFDADYLDNPKPAYPAISRRLGEQGRVLLRVHVGNDGGAGDEQLHTSSGSPRLDQSALDTVRRWRFVPAKLGREPVAAWVLVPIAFTLKD